MRNNVFREKSLERIQSPEALNDYIRVSNPGIWLLLAAVIILLLGACVWGAFGHVSTTLDVLAVAEGGNISCTVTEEQFAEVETGMTVTVGSESGTVSALYRSNGSCRVLVDGLSLPDGSFPAQIVVETIHPLSLIFN